MYALLRAIAGVALRWYYRDIQVQGLEYVPARRPLLLVVNHPNALVDALLVGWIMPRRVLITAKSTLFQNPLSNLLLHWLGVVPLRRASDEPRAGASADRSRNTDTFQAVREALGRRGTVLIFPEGKTHDEPHLSPLKTGAARMALDARDSGAAPDVAIVPVGLTFERKDAPRTRVLVQVGEPILMDVWTAPTDNVVEALTGEIETRLRAVTMNYATPDDAARAVTLATTIAALFNPAERMNPRGGSLSVETTIARRIDALARILPLADEHMRVRADDLTRRLDAIQREVADRRLLLEDADVSLRNRDGVRFVLREG